MEEEQSERVDGVGEEENVGVWKGVCLDDGTGRNVYFVSDSGERSRRVPHNYIPELFPNGERRYYYRLSCIRCRKAPAPSVFITKWPYEEAVSYNMCEECLVTTTFGITRVRGNGSAIMAANADAPKHMMVDLKGRSLNPNRDSELLNRCIEARYWSQYDSKLLRNKQRRNLVKQKAAEYGITEGTLLSWGFGDSFDEYYGHVNEHGQPHGEGVRFYSDGSVYCGGWLDGERHTSDRGLWSRPDGSTYEGTWVAGLKHGKGTQTYPNGSVYKGEFAKGYEHGHGHKQMPDGSTFEGRYRFGRRDGPGVLTDKDGHTERGNFLDPKEVFHEQPVPQMLESITADSSALNAPSLQTLSIHALGQAMHTHRAKAAPARKLQRYVPEHLKKPLAREFLHLMTPAGTQSFLENGPNYAFNLLDEVEFTDVKITQADCSALMYFQNSNLQLKKLKCTSNKLELTSIDLISRNLVSRAWPTLESLDLSFNIFDPTALKSLTAGIERISTLRFLRLAACNIKPSGAFILANFLSADKQIETLDLAFNSIEAMGAESIAEALVDNVTLTSLNLRGNNIGVLGGEAFVECMQSNLALRVLCLADNGVGEGIITELSARLRGTIKDIALSVRVSELTMPSRYVEGRYDPRHVKMARALAEKKEE